MQEINQSFQQKHISHILDTCLQTNHKNFGTFVIDCLAQKGLNAELLEPYREKFQKIIRVKLLCNWCSSLELHELWRKMRPENSNIILVDDDGMVDFWVIVNLPSSQDYFEPSRTIIFQMEPISLSGMWKQIENEKGEQFLHIFSHSQEFNNLEWHLSKTCDELLNQKIVKSFDQTVSTVLSGKYFDEGHILRVDFVKYAEKHVDFHVFGSNTFDYKQYKGSLPSHQKDNGMFPYKYVFNAENHNHDFYVTEKLVDAILSECLCFYWGCPNLEEWIDSRAFVRLDLNDKQGSLEIIKQCLENGEWEKRIDIIRQEKRRILNDLQFFPRLENFLKSMNK